MKWTAQKTKKGISNGQYWVQVQYSADSGLTAEDVFRSTVNMEQWPDASVRARLLELNALDLDVIELGDIKPEPAPIEPEPPTQEELARQAWLVNLQTWKRLKTELELGVSKTTTQADVDDAFAVVKAGYLPEYGDFL